MSFTDVMAAKPMGVYFDYSDFKKEGLTREETLHVIKHGWVRKRDGTMLRLAGKAEFVVTRADGRKEVY